jgi:hypothetical protein
MATPPISVFFFFLQFCDVAKTSNYPQEDLTKFGYILDMKIKQIRTLSNFDYLLESVVEIWRIKIDFFKIW